MDDNHGMIPMGGPGELEERDEREEREERDTAGTSPGVPPTVKARNAAQQEVSRLLDALAPDKPPARATAKNNDVERHRTLRGCLLQATAGAVTVSWFPDSAQGAELGELQVIAWRGTVSHPGSSLRTSGANVIEEMVLKPVEGGPGEMTWHAADGTRFSTSALAIHCARLLAAWTRGASEEA